MNPVVIISVLWQLRNPIIKIAGLFRRNKKKSAGTVLIAIILGYISGEYNMESLLSPEVISLVISGAIALAGALFGNRVLKYKKTITEGFEAISVILEAFKDGKLTPDEAKRIQKEVQDVIKALSGNGK